MAAVALFGFVLLLFVPLVYDPTMVQCLRAPSCVFGCFCPSNQSGLESISYALLHWGGVYSFEYFPSTIGYSFVPEQSFQYSNGDIMTPFAILLFIALPIAIVGAGLIEPEIATRSRAAGVAYVILGLFTLTIATGYFSLASYGSMYPLLGVALGLVGGAIALFPSRHRVFRLASYLNRIFAQD